MTLRIGLYGIKAVAGITESTTAWAPILFHGFNVQNIVAEANKSYPCRTAGILSKFRMYVGFNDRGASTARIRVAGADGNQVFSIGASATGFFSDETNTDSISVGNLICFQIQTGAGGTNFYFLTAAVLLETNNILVIRNSWLGGNNTVDNAYYYLAFQGQGANLTESVLQYKTFLAMTLRNHNTYVSANARTTTSSLGTRKNGVDTSLVVSVGAGATGRFENTSDTVSIAVDDLLCHFILLGAGSAEVLSFTACGCEVLYPDTTFQFMSITAGTTLNVATNYYLTPSGAVVINTTLEDGIIQKVLTNIKTSGLRILVQSNTISAASTFKSRKDYSDGNMTVSIPSGATGYFEDAVNSDTLIASSFYNFMLMVGATGTSIIVQFYCCKALLEPIANLTGTAMSSITEADIVAGGKTIIMTLAGDTFIPA